MANCAAISIEGFDGALTQPVVLVGGASRRFGRDKLLEPLADGRPLVCASIDALREVFGRSVMLVGRCDPRVESLGDGAFPDLWQNAGPAGGIASALAHTGTAVFVLSGDLPGITADTLRHVMAASLNVPGALAVLATAGIPEPCVGLYRATALHPLRRALNELPRRSIVKSLGAHRVTLVDVDASAIANANTPQALAEAQSAARGGIPQ